MSDAIVIADLPAPKLTERLSWQPCHDWNGGRGLPGSAEALLMTCNQCGQTVASPSHFGDAKPCVMRLAPNSWLGVNPARFAVEFLQSEFEHLRTDTIPAALIEAERRGMMRAAEIADTTVIWMPSGRFRSDECGNAIRQAAAELGAK